MHYKSILIRTLILTSLVLLGIGLFIFIVDPYQRYRPNDLYIGNQRLEIAGIAANHDYDAFISGSSMTMNHYPGQVDTLFGWETRNFSIMGATYDDYAIMLPYILSKGKTKNIILGIDFFSFARQRAAVPEYLYDDNVLNDYKYLWNYTSFKDAVAMTSGKGVKEKDLYHFNSAFGRKELQNNFNGLIKHSYEGEIFDLDSMKNKFDNSVFRIVKESPQINWYIYFPPYSIGEFIVYQTHDDLDANIGMRNYMAQKLLKLKNVELYDFQRSPIITDLDAYMDLRHHSHAVNRMIIQSIHDKKYLANDSTIRSNSEKLRVLCKQYKPKLITHD